MKKFIFELVLLFFFQLLFIGCGGSNEKTEQNNLIIKTGHLIDSPIKGIDYICDTIHKVTDKNGTFEYFPDKNIKFYIGTSFLGKVSSVKTDGFIFLQDLKGIERNIVDDNKVIALATFLQSIDEDNNSQNGIDISSSIIEKLNNSDIKLNKLTEKESHDLIISLGKKVKSQEAVIEELRLSLNTYITIPSNSTPTNQITTPHNSTPTNQIITPNNSTSTNIILDSTTNLIWQNNTKSKTKTFSQAQEYCNDLTINKYSDWRVPSLRELFTIVDTSESNPAIKDKFNNTISLGYWTSTTYPLDNNLIMGINFYDGSDGISNKNTPQYVRCVTGDYLTPSSFKRAGDNTVMDTTNNLEWQDNNETKNQFLTHEEATSYCDELTLSEKDDWRVPTIEELRSIVDRREANPAINLVFQNSLNSFFWSSTPYQIDNKKVWTIFFTDGNDYQKLKSNKAYIRCVR